MQLALALAGTGLMTAIAAAAIGARQGTSEGAMAAAILAQRIADGTPTATTTPVVSTPLSTPTPGSPAEAATRQSILAETATIEVQMQTTIVHTEKLRTDAYKQKDIIRLNTVTAKLGDMKQIMLIAQGAFVIIRIPGQDIFVMRSKLSTVRQGWDRMREALATAESAEGDSANSVSSGIGPENVEADPSAGVTDVGLPASAQIDTGRPGYASPFK